MLCGEIVAPGNSSLNDVTSEARQIQLAFRLVSVREPHLGDSLALLL